MMPSYQFLPPDHTPGLVLHPDRFSNALIDAYVKIQPQDVVNDDILDVTVPIILIPQNVYNINTRCNTMGLDIFF